MKKNLLTTLLLLLIGLTHARAQDALVPAGGDASSSGGSVSYSLNYVAYTTVSGPGGSVSPGPLHPIETYVVLSSRTSTATLTYGVYPNPTSGGITLKAAGIFRRNCSYQLSDLQGRVMKMQSLEGPITSISLEQLPPAVYLLTVSQGNKAAQIFKIIKH